MGVYVLSIMYYMPAYPYVTLVCVPCNVRFTCVNYGFLFTHREAHVAYE